MTSYDIIFYLLAAVILISAGISVFSEKKINIISGLFCTFMGISGLFALLSAVTLALAYMIFFGVMLTSLFLFILPQLTVTSDQNKQEKLLFPVLMTGIVSALLRGILITTKWNLIPAGENNFSFGDLSSLLISKYSLPLAITSVIIFSVIIGTFYLLRQGKK